jgi:hypothetical protein
MSPIGGSMALQTLRFGSDPQLVAASMNKPALSKGAKGEGVAIYEVVSALLTKH